MTSSRPITVAPIKAVGPTAPTKPVGSMSAVVLRLVGSGLLLAVYFTFYSKITDLLTLLLRSSDSSQVAPRVTAVTGLGIALVALWWKLNKGDPRFHAPILITYILAIGDATFGILESHHSEWLSQLTHGRLTSYNPTFLVIAAACVMELALSRFVYGKWPHLASAYISGISAGILVKSPELWPFVLTGLISITSKYVLRVGGRHLWNPTNFGVSLMAYLASNHMAVLSVQTGNEWWPVVLIWILGSLILYRFRLLHIPVVFVACFALFSYLRSFVTGNQWVAELAPVTSPMFQLYIFFMITDPKTITKTRGRQCLVALLIAVMETALRLAFRDVYSLLHALFIVGPLANLVEIVWAPKPKANPAKVGA